MSSTTEQGVASSLLKAGNVRFEKEDNDKYTINFFSDAKFIGLNGYNGLVFNIHNKSPNSLSFSGLEMYIRSDMPYETDYRIFIAETEEILKYRSSLGIPFQKFQPEGEELFPITNVKRVAIEQARKISQNNVRDTSHVLVSLQQGSLVLGPYTGYLLYILKDGFRYLAPSNTDYAKPATGVSADDAANFVIFENEDLKVYSGYGVMSHSDRVSFQGFEPRYYLGKMNYQRMLPALFKSGRKLFQPDVTLLF